MLIYEPPLPLSTPARAVGDWLSGAWLLLPHGGTEQARSRLPRWADSTPHRVLLAKIPQSHCPSILTVESHYIEYISRICAVQVNAPALVLFLDVGCLCSQRERKTRVSMRHTCLQPSRETAREGSEDASAHARALSLSLSLSLTLYLARCHVAHKQRHVGCMEEAIER